MKKLTIALFCLLPLLTGCGDVIVYPHKIQKAITYCKGAEKISSVYLNMSKDNIHDKVTCMDGSKESLSNITTKTL